MASIKVGIKRSNCDAFEEILHNTELVDVEAISTVSTDSPCLIYTLDAGVGNSINYFYLGIAWGQRLLAEGGQTNG